VRVDVGEVCWVAEITVEEAGEQRSLEGGREERGDDAQTYLLSGLLTKPVDRFCYASSLTWHVMVLVYGESR
jgi:hypothetical protein